MVTIAQARQEVARRTAVVKVSRREIKATRLPGISRAQLQQRGVQQLAGRRIQAQQLERGKQVALKGLVSVEAGIKVIERNIEKEVQRVAAVAAAQQSTARDIAIVQKVIRKELSPVILTKSQKKLWREVMEPGFKARMEPIKEDVTITELPPEQIAAISKPSLQGITKEEIIARVLGKTAIIETGRRKLSPAELKRARAEVTGATITGRPFKTQLAKPLQKVYTIFEKAVGKPLTKAQTFLQGLFGKKGKDVLSKAPRVLGGAGVSVSSLGGLGPKSVPREGEVTTIERGTRKVLGKVRVEPMRDQITGAIIIDQDVKIRAGKLGETLKRTIKTRLKAFVGIPKQIPTRAIFGLFGLRKKEVEKKLPIGGFSMEPGEKPFIAPDIRLPGEPRISSFSPEGEEGKIEQIRPAPIRTIDPSFPAIKPPKIEPGTLGDPSLPLAPPPSKRFTPITGATVTIGDKKLTKQEIIAKILKTKDSKAMKVTKTALKPGGMLGAIGFIVSKAGELKKLKGSIPRLLKGEPIFLTDVQIAEAETKKRAEEAKRIEEKRLTPEQAREQFLKEEPVVSVAKKKGIFDPLTITSVARKAAGIGFGILSFGAGRLVKTIPGVEETRKITGGKELSRVLITKKGIQTAEKFGGPLVLGVAFSQFFQTGAGAKVKVVQESREAALARLTKALQGKAAIQRELIKQKTWAGQKVILDRLAKQAKTPKQKQDLARLVQELVKDNIIKSPSGIRTAGMPDLSSVQTGFKTPPPPGIFGDPGARVASITKEISKTAPIVGSETRVSGTTGLFKAIEANVLTDKVLASIGIGKMKFAGLITGGLASIQKLVKGTKLKETQKVQELEAQIQPGIVSVGPYIEEEQAPAQPTPTKPRLGTPTAQVPAIIPTVITTIIQIPGEPVLPKTITPQSPKFPRPTGAVVGGGGRGMIGAPAPSTLLMGDTGSALRKLKGMGVDIHTGMVLGRRRILKKNVPPFKALKLASTYVDRNIEASFVLIPSGKKIKERDIKSFKLSRKFRPSKTNPLFIVEKKRYRLDSPGERRQIKDKKGKRRRF